jgi:hypothetical protein
MFCRSLFVLFLFSLWPLCCLFFDIHVWYLPTLQMSSSSNVVYLTMCINYSWLGARVAQWGISLALIAHTSLSPIRCGFAPSFVNYKKGALDSQPQVIQFTSCLPMVGGSFWVLRLLPPLKLVAMILLKYALNTINQINLSVSKKTSL